MNKKTELLAPAGSYEAFIAAVENGADAVYMGGKLFNARANATNFELEELEKIVQYAHLRDVRIHITLNTLLDDEEIEQAVEYAKELYKIGVDAVIVQDLGLATALHKYLPNLELHASTQLSTHNLEGVIELHNLGFSRVVLARELTIEETNYIVQNAPCEIEIFCHGAQCVCYSGECLMSSMIGDRSGNRGKCAQPCRLPYTLLKNNHEVAKGYLLSPKDLMTLDILDKLPNVSCLKIEGRMKSPEYVATVVGMYRKYLDKNLNDKLSIEDHDINSEISDTSSKLSIESKGTASILSVEKQDLEDITQIFNRGGFSRSYLEGKDGKDHMCYESPKNWGTYLGKVIDYKKNKFITLQIDKEALENHTIQDKIIIGDGIEIWNKAEKMPSGIVTYLKYLTEDTVVIGEIHGDIKPGDKIYRTSSKSLNTKARESFTRGFVKHSKVSASLYMKLNEPIKITINEFEYTSDVMPEAAKNVPLSAEKLETQLRKTGNTPFEIGSLTITMDDNLFVPVSVLNEIRRKAFEEYEQLVVSKMYNEVLDFDCTISNYFSTLDFSNKSFARKNFDTSNDSESKLNSEAKIEKHSKEISIFFNILKPEHKNINGVDTMYFAYKDAIKHMDIIDSFECKKYVLMPTITKANYAKTIKNTIDEISSHVDGFVLSNIGQLEYVKNIRSRKYLDLIANYTFNCFNTYSALLLGMLGFSKVVLSPELTKCQINNISYEIEKLRKQNPNANVPELELISYGNTCVMTSEYCPIGSCVGGFCKNQKCSMPCTKGDVYYLKDRKNMEFRIISDNIDCQSRIFNCKTTSIETKDILVKSLRIDLIDESNEEIEEIIENTKLGTKLNGDKYTNGHLNRPV